MKVKSALLVLAAFLFMMFPEPGRADVDVGISIGDDGVKGFYLAVGDYYKVPEKTVLVVKKRNIPDEDLPVVFFMARQAEVDPSVIVKLRLGGLSWMDITLHYGLTAQIFYVPVKNVSGPPYGKAYGYYKKRPKDKWKEIRLNDSEVANFVNLKFVSTHYGCSPEEVINMRSEGNSFITINTEIKKSKGKKAPDKETSKGKSKGKGDK